MANNGVSLQVNYNRRIEFGLRDVAKDLKDISLAPSLGSITTFAEAVLDRIQAGGRLIVTSPGSRSPQAASLAHHLVEETRVRYKAGKPFDRPDRPAMPTLEVADGTNPIHVSYRFNAKDNLVVFGDSLPQVDFPIISAAVNAGANILFLTAAERTVPGVELPKNPISRQAAGEAALHAICEYFEPEPPMSPKGVYLEVAAVVEQMAGEAATGQFSGLISTFRNAVETGTPIFVIGNGGSTCDAEIITENLLQNLSRAKKTTHVEVPIKGGQMTCAWNDAHTPFLRTVQCFGDENHPVLVVALTTSGNSGNIKEVIDFLAETKTGKSIALLGKGGGVIARDSKPTASYTVPHGSTGHVQISHVVLASLLGSCL